MATANPSRLPGRRAWPGNGAMASPTTSTAATTSPIHTGHRRGVRPADASFVGVMAPAWPGSRAGASPPRSIRRTANAVGEVTATGGCAAASARRRWKRHPELSGRHDEQDPSHDRPDPLGPRRAQVVRPRTQPLRRPQGGEPRHPRGREHRDHRQERLGQVDAHARARAARPAHRRAPSSSRAKTPGRSAARNSTAPATRRSASSSSSSSSRRTPRCSRT